MARVDRIAAVAVLVALCLGARANAALDPARMFAPGSESFLPPIGAKPAAVSVISAAIFHERLALLDADFASVIGGVHEPAGSGLAIVSFEPANVDVDPSFHPSIPAANLATPAMPQNQPVQVPSTSPVSAAPVTVPQSATPARFGTYTPYAPGLGTQASVSTPVRVGNLRFETAFGAMQHCGTADEAAACAQSVSAGTAFNVRAGDRNLHLRLESGVSEVANQNAGVFQYVPLDPDAQAGLSSPNVSNIFGQNVSAQLAIPVTQRLTVGLQFDRTYLQGNTALTDTSAFQGMRDTYLGNLTYQLPKGSSAITFSARQYRYQDLLWPDLKSSQMRADLKFTVKF